MLLNISEDDYNLILLGLVTLSHRVESDIKFYDSLICDFRYDLDSFDDWFGSFESLLNHRSSCIKSKHHLDVLIKFFSEVNKNGNVNV